MNDQAQIGSRQPEGAPAPPSTRPSPSKATGPSSPESPEAAPVSAPSSSSPDTTPSAASEAPGAPDALEWTVHPLVERPRQTLALAAILALVLVLVWLNIPEPGWVVFAAAILFVSLARFFFPTTYRLDDAGVHVRFLGFQRDHRWDRFRRLEAGRHGLFLSPFPHPNRLDNFRGLFLLWGANRKEVEAFARERVHRVEGPRTQPAGADPPPSPR